MAASNNGTVSANKGTLTFQWWKRERQRFWCVQCRGWRDAEYLGTRTEASGATFGGAGKVDVGGNVTFTAASNLTNTGTFEVDGAVVVASGVNVITSI